MVVPQLIRGPSAEIQAIPQIQEQPAEEQVIVAPQEMIEAQQNVQEVVQEQIPVIEEPAQIAQQPQPDEQIDTAGNPVEEHKNQRIQEDIIPEHILNPPRYKVAVNYGEDVQFEQDTFFLEGLFDENVFEPTEEEKIL